jgi:hypothetical protein
MRLKLKLLLALFTVILSLPATAQADALLLTGGTVSIQVPPGQTSISVSRPGIFTLNYVNSEYAGPLVTSFGFQSITQGFGSLTFNDLTTQYFTGSLGFDNSLLTGQITAFRTLDDALNNNPLFTLTFSGEGFLVSSSSSRSFTVATPEPATLLLLGSGLGAATMGARRKRKKKESSLP